MPRLAFRRIPLSSGTGYTAASVSISQELAPVPFTICGLKIVVHCDISTTSVTNFNDYYDRLIGSLNLSGQFMGQNKTFFGFTEMRLPYHFSRKQLKQHAPRRPTVIAGSQTNAKQQFDYVIHFGANPINPDGSFNWMDLTAGIPRVDKGQLTLGGAWGAAGAAGTNVTLNTGATTSYAEIFVYGAQALPGEIDADVMPMAIPVWSMASATPAATSSMFATPYNVTGGGFLRDLSLMVTRGTNAPRDRQTLSDIRLYNAKLNYPIIEFGGRAGNSDAGGGDYEIAELATQTGVLAYSDDGSTLGVPTVTPNADAGLVHFVIADYLKGPAAVQKGGVHPLFGADLRQATSGDYRLDMGVANATTIAVDVLYQRYELNPLHPANAAWL